MSRPRLAVAVFAVAALVFSTASLAAADQPDSPGNSDTAHSKNVCGPPSNGVASCHAKVVTKGDGVTPDATTSYASGYKPSDLQSAYKLPSGGSTQTVAIVDAYDNPNAKIDLDAYRTQFGLPALPVCSVTITTSCFQKVNQSGGSTPPAADVGWGQEIALDLDMASAVCPNCKILLVEANSNAYTDLGAAVDRAALMSANAISNSYGGGEFSVEGSSTYNGHYNHPGIAVTVSSGDGGYGVEFPAASGYVTAVGGTSLTKNTSTRGWTESAWSGAGSGCSRYIAKPSWQHDSGCSRRTVADVSAVHGRGRL